MGFTPFEGLVMGTRSGDIDPAIVGYLARRAYVPIEQVEQWLNERSGLRGLSGLSQDMRDLLAAEENGDARAELAIEVFCYRVRNISGHTWRSWAESTRCFLAEVSASTLRKSVPASATGWTGAGLCWTGNEMRRWSACPPAERPDQPG